MREPGSPPGWRPHCGRHSLRPRWRACYSRGTSRPATRMRAHMPPSLPAGLGSSFRVWAARRPPGPSRANPRGSSTMRALSFLHVPWPPLAPSGLVGALRAPLISYGRAPRPSASEAGFRSAPGATKALAPLVARPAVSPTGPAARGYDAGDDMTTSGPLGCMHPWSSSVGRGDRG